MLILVQIRTQACVQDCCEAYCPGNQDAVMIVAKENNFLKSDKALFQLNKKVIQRKGTGTGTQVPGVGWCN